jgi:hypothetical protein
VCICIDSLPTQGSHDSEHGKGHAIWDLCPLFRGNGRGICLRFTASSIHKVGSGGVGILGWVVLGML